MPSTGMMNGGVTGMTGGMSGGGFTKVSQRSRGDNVYGTGSAGSLAHASNYFNAAKYALQAILAVLGLVCLVFSASLFERKRSGYGPDA